MDAAVIVIGGGLAGLTASLELARSGVEVLLLEKRNYPVHKVCGEYVSNEVRPYLESLGLDIAGLGAAPIGRLAVSSPSGRTLEAPLRSGGFGISRYRLDRSMYGLGVDAGVRFLPDTSVSQVQRTQEGFRVQTAHGDFYESRYVIGAYGKRSSLDVKAGRSFTRKASPYMAVKYHIRYDQPEDLIALHNFKGGYGGISAIEDGKCCFCYLTERSGLKDSGGSLARLEHEVLGKNPFLKRIFSEAEFLYERPLVINCVENGMLMAGDTAGLIAPLCGNGMAIAIHGAKILSALVRRSLEGALDRTELEAQYRRQWQRTFGVRLAAGRIIQPVFGRKWLTDAALALLGPSPALTRYIIGLTHGNDILQSR
ncbi:MAG: FAD-dependent oxidoreductase [Cytophagaceae bacterium SCN 52-12]|nr:MAG: FAD-dependent oxidoreductase [Cytophagaceae bacterium SCN 52-12]